MAMQLIDSLRAGFEPTRYHDTYRDALCEIIKQKREGETVKAPEHDSTAQVPDLMAALQASLDRSKGGEVSGANGSSLKSLSKDDLYKRAQEKDVPGRADMTKDQLVDALSAA